MKLGELAEQFDLVLDGDPEKQIEGVGTIEQASNDQIAFLANPKYRKFLRETHAGAVVLSPELAAECPTPSLSSDNPSYARIASLFDGARNFAPGIHPSAIVADDASVSATAYVGPFAVIETGCVVKAGTFVGAHCLVGQASKLEAQSYLYPRVTVYYNVVVGERSIIHSGAVIGADGFGIAMDAGHWVKVPQLGGVRIGADCEIGANTTIDRGAIEHTVLGDDVRIDNQVQIGHNVQIGAHTAIAGCAAIAGSTKVGQYCLIGGGAGLVGHISVCDRVTVNAMGLVTHSIKEPGEYASGAPLQSSRDWRRNAVRMRQLDDWVKRVKKLEG